MIEFSYTLLIKLCSYALFTMYTMIDNIHSAINMAQSKNAIKETLLASLIYTKYKLKQICVHLAFCTMNGSFT